MAPPRLGWFSPMPPVRSGIAGRSAELVADLRRDFDIDVFDIPPRSGVGGDVAFIWRHQQRPYDLCVYQFGNSAHHEGIWAYALRYPGLVVLHETRLHHARAAALLRGGRPDDYRAELAWNEPGINPDLAELAIAGFDSRLYYDWPMVRALVASARLTAVHGEGARAELLARLNGRGVTEAVTPDRIAAIQLGDGVAFTPAQRSAARQRIRASYGIPEDAVLFGCFGGLTPEKRVPQILQALPAVLAGVPGARLLLAGAAAPYYDVAADVSAHGLSAAVTLTGYLDSEDALTEHMAACDVGLNLRWPTVRETSAPWIRAIALGLPTITTRLMHTADVPAMRVGDAERGTRDARGGTRGAGRGMRDAGCGMRDAGRGMRDAGSETRDAGRGMRDAGCGMRDAERGTRDAGSGTEETEGDPVTLAIDVADEARDLPAAMRLLATDAALRERLGAAAHAWWSREHTFERMAADYRRVIAAALARRAPDVHLPPHMRTGHDALLRNLVTPFGPGVTEYIRGI